MDGETDMVDCFFERSHRIYRSRYPYHLQRCSRQHPNVKHKFCPYNASHVMVPEDYDRHIATCENRPPPIPSASDASHATANVPVIGSWEEEEGAGTWGTEKPVVPNIQERNQFVYSPCIGGSKGERVQHKHAERRQFTQFEEKAREAQAEKDKMKKKKKKNKKKTHSSKSNSENIYDACGNKPISNKVGSAPLAERI